ncbi:MAG: hypothetical protein FGF52_01870 [Candidatus Brockarchaeota archaeon]|nr:hypothetical protein [Candidatus Brockarchaeota archaeon]
MKPPRSVWFVATVFLFTIAIGEALFLINLKMQLESKEKAYSGLLKSIEGITNSVSILIKYDNGTKTWFNNTRVPVGWSLFNLTNYVTNGRVDYQTTFGVFITGINGVGSHDTYYWIWYRWDPVKKDWMLGETGCDSYFLNDGDVLAWYLVDTSSWPPEKP